MFKINIQLENKPLLKKNNFCQSRKRLHLFKQIIIKEILIFIQKKLYFYIFSDLSDYIIIFYIFIKASNIISNQI